MRVGILGAAEVLRDGEPVELGGRKQRMLLSALALYAGQPVPVDSLIDMLWRDSPPPSALSTLQVYLAGVRKALEPDRPARTLPRTVVTVAPGYALRLPGDCLDAARFAAVVDAAHRRLGSWSDEVSGAIAAPELEPDELGPVITALDDALALWRGTPYLDLDDAPAAIAERGRLEELRLVALEDRAVARLALGLHATLAAELEALTAEHPLRERLWALRVLALAGAGRQADALDALRRVRRVLADELGLDPGTPLRELELAVLRQDPQLVWRPKPGNGSHVLPVATGPVPDAATGAATGAGAGGASQWPLVGRVAELAALERLLDEAGAAPQFAVLTGEPGIGKTRLASEIAARARSRGFAVLTGRCSEDEGAPPLWPWIGVLRALADTVDLPDAVRRQLAELTGLLEPGVAGPSAPAEDVDAARFRLWTMTSDVLVSASRIRPLLVILDDLHWADPSSLKLLRHLADMIDTGRLLVVATRRAAPALAGQLAAVAESLARRHALRLDLPGLTTSEAAALVEVATHRQPGGREAEALRARTDGNPFFLVELLRDGRGDVPAAVTDIVARRVARLPEATGELLRTAAVIGREFDLAVLAAATGCDEDELLDALDPALAAGVLAEGDRLERFRFAHALVRDVVYAGLPAARRARRHAVIARVLEDTDAAPSETARHWLAAGPAHAARAWRSAAVAAEHATRLYGYDEAAGLLAAALDVQRTDGAATPLDRYGLLMARADACRWSVDRDGLDAALTAAVQEAEQLGDVVRMAQAAVSTAEGALWQTRAYGRADRHMIATLRRALRELPAEDQELRCRVLLVLATELYHTDAPAYREALVEQGLAMARRLGDPALLVWACQAAFIAIWRPATAPDRLRLADEALASAVEQADPVREALARTLRVIVTCELGLVAEMRDEISRLRQIAEPRRLVYVLIVLTELEPPWLAMQGRFDEADRLIEQRRELVAGASLPQRDESMVAAPACIELWRTGAAGIVPAFRALASVSPMPFDLTVQWLLVRAGRLEEARTVRAEPVPSTDDWVSVHHYCIAAEVAFALERPAAARSVYHWLSPYAGRVCSAGFSVAIGPVDAFLAFAAMASGEREIASRHADTALELCAEWEIPLAAQWLREQRDRGGF
ncbi:transcriptional regulator [Kribbella pratensis]|uniref:Transcriptional regulator n=1 Tax=Kribbella pratensis TaxID=2512112 RepID=A0ABY2F4Z6_9ACTN|nr:BTAD domain-containing putative transcriptional regulator [Kribbella pratensis]TDW81606.1 transcriptional regulator [Kribbella pratensis]